jgi:hypothetical protein
MKLKLYAALVVALVAAPLTQGCASTGGVKKGGYVATVATTQALNLIQTTEMQLVCDRPGAPAAPLCLTIEKHKAIEAKLADAIKVNIKAIDAFAALPPTITAPTPEVLNFVAQVWAAIEEIRGLLPDGKPKEAATEKLSALKQ